MSNSPASPRVFLSYSRVDEDFAKQLYARLENAGLKLWRDREAMEGGRSWWQQITDALDDVTHMVLVASPDAIASPVVRREWRYARQQGVCIHPVQVPGRTLDFGSLPRWMSKVHFYDLENDNWETLVNYLKNDCDEARVPFMAPELSHHYVQRSQEFERLKTLVLAANGKGQTVALRGGGGFGKTTLAAALCHDEDIAEAFSDGILWVTLGEKPDRYAAISAIVNALRGGNLSFADDDSARTALRQALADRDCLLVIDDAWKSSDLRLLMGASDKSARLITTRNLDIAIAAEAEQIEVDAMQANEAADLLSAGLATAPSLRPTLHHLAARLGEWPLLLEIANGILRKDITRGRDLPEALERLEQRLERKGFVGLRRQGEEGRKASAAATLAVSLDHLEAHEREAFASLGILAEDAAVPLSTLCVLWEVDDFDAEDLVERYADLSLIKFDPDNQSIRLHDVLRQILAEDLPDAAAHHTTLIERWGNAKALPDTYAWQFYSYHLHHAGQGETLAELLLDFEWLSAKLRATSSPNSLLRDFDYAPKLHKNAIMIESLRLVKSALSISAHCLDDYRLLAGQLYGRLMPKPGETTPEAYSHLRALLAACRQEPLLPRLLPLYPTMQRAGGALVRTFLGHSGWVNSIDVLPDGTFVSGADDRTLRLWDIETGEELRVMSGHGKEVRAVLALPDGRVVSAAADKTLRVWDAQRGVCLSVLKGHDGKLSTLALLPDGRVASGSFDHTVRIWDIDSGQCQQVLRRHGGAVTALAVLADGQLVSGCKDGYLYVWEAETYKPSFVLESHYRPIKSLCALEDGGLLSIGDNRRMFRWESINADCSVVDVEILGHYDCTVPRSQGTLVVGSKENDLHGIDLFTGKAYRYGQHASTIFAVQWAGFRQVLSGSRDHSIKLWNVSNAREEEAMLSHVTSVTDIRINPAGRFVSAAEDAWVIEWNVEAPALESHIMSPDAILSNTILCPLPDGTFIRGYDPRVTLVEHPLQHVNLHTGEVLRDFEGQERVITDIQLLPDGEHFLAASADRSTALYHIQSSAILHRFKGHKNVVTGIAIHPDGRRFVTSSTDHSLRVWDWQKRELIGTLNGHRNWVRGVTILPDGRTISACRDTTLKVWDTDNLSALGTLFGHKEAVNTVAALPGGRHVVSGGYDHLLCLWDVEEMRLLRQMQFDSAVLGLAVRQRDGVIATGNYSGAVHFVQADFG